MKVFGFAGWSGSGKTVLIERIIPLLTGRGLDVSLIKRAHHEFDVDVPGKDSDRHRRAGCREVLISSGVRWAHMHELRGEPEQSLQQLVDRISPCDLLLVEGFKREAIPKMEIFRRDNGKAALHPHDPHIVAIAADCRFDTALPQFDLNDAPAIAEFVADFNRLDSRCQTRAEPAEHRSMKRLPAVDRPEPGDVLAHLASRYSVSPKHLDVPAPGHAELMRAAALALRAPDHEALRPYRFVHIAAHQRARLGELYALGARRRGCDEADVQRARERAHNGPCLLAMVGRIEDGALGVPEGDQWLCAGAALMNFVNALHLMGYGAKVLGGASIKDADVQQAFCAPGETLLCWIVTGTPKCAAHSRYSDDATLILGDWDGGLL